jgi:predicted DsbA family dithiol-disulfide isomerase
MKYHSLPGIGPDVTGSNPTGADALDVRIYSDVVCPWCYIGKRRFEAALALPECPPVRVRWMPFQLDPGAPAQGEPVAEAYAKKFGGAARAQQIMAQVTEAAAGEGLEFHLDRAIRSNTFDAHRLLWWAGSVGANPETSTSTSTGSGSGSGSARLPGQQSALKESLLAAYFNEGLDVSDHRVLAARATEVGLDTDQATEVLASGTGTDEVRSELADAMAHDVTAVPTFILDGRLAIPGAQDPATIARHLARIAASTTQ